MIRLCLELEQIDASSAGLVNDWQHLRFQAYEQAGMTEDMINFAYHLAVKGEEEYYEKLKNLASAEKWPETVSLLLEEFKGICIKRNIVNEMLLS